MAERLNTAQAIGALTAQVEAMNKRLDRDREDRIKLDDEAAKSRAAVRESLTELQAGHQAILRRVDKIEPVADMVTSWKARVIGGLAVLGVIGGIIITTVTFFKDAIIKSIWGA